MIRGRAPSGFRPGRLGECRAGPRSRDRPCHREVRARHCRGTVYVEAGMRGCWTTLGLVALLAPRVAVAQNGDTPAACLAEVQQERSKDMERMRSENVPIADMYRALDDSTAARSRRCADRFPIRGLSASQLLGAVSLYSADSV